MAGKLINTKKTSKCYRSLQKKFLNSKKIPLIPLLFHNNRFVSYVKHKAELFNDFFSNQCSLINNTSKLAINLITLLIGAYPWLHFQLAILLKLFKTLIQIKHIDATLSVFGC